MIRAELEAGRGDPLGNVIIAGEGNSILTIENTFVDAWLAALLEGVRRVRNDEHDVEVDLVDEPWPVHIRRTGDRVRLSYRDREIDLGSITTVCSELASDASRLLPSLRAITESPTLLHDIEREIGVLVSSGE